MHTVDPYGWTILKNNKQQSVPVVTGLISDTQTEIVSGLNEGDLVVTSSSGFSLSEQNGTSPFGTSDMRIMRMAR